MSVHNPLFFRFVVYFSMLLANACTLNNANKTIPFNIPAIDTTQFDFQITEEWQSLGKSLFFDPILSDDSSISCSSCHMPQFAFSSPSPKAKGINGNLARRNAAALFNLAYHPYFFSDGGSPSLPTQALAPLTDTNEMGANLVALQERLNNNAFWSRKFLETTGSKPSIAHLTRALAAYQISLLSFKAPYDLSNMRTQNQALGEHVFMQFCATCHKPPLFSTFEFERIGLDNIYANGGRAIISGNTADSGKFKVPSIRNWAFTAPYMHDGRFQSIHQVLDFYQNGKQNPNNPSEKIKSINFDDQQKMVLLNFLELLNDTAFVEEYSQKNFFEPMQP